MKNRTVCLVFMILFRIVVRSVASSVTLTISSNGTGTKGSTVHMACIITNYPSDKMVEMFKMTAADAMPGSPICYCPSITSICHLLLTHVAISNPIRYTYIRNTKGTYLTIADVQHEDTGWWRCYLDEGDVSSNAEQLVVYKSPVGVTYTSQPIGSQDLAITSVTLVCQTINCSYPASTFIWYSVEKNTRTVYRNTSPGTVATVSRGCTRPGNIYSSTLTLPRYTTSTANVPKTAKFVCGISHPALIEDKFTPLTEDITFAERVTSVSLTYEGTIPATGTEIHAVTGTKTTLGVEWSPTGCNVKPTIICYVGIIATVLPGAIHTFTFTVLDNLINNEIYCTANNISPNELSTNKLRLKLIEPIVGVCTCSPCNYVGPAVGASLGGMAVTIVIAAVMFFFCRQTGKGIFTGTSGRTENINTAEVKSTEEVATSVHNSIDGSGYEEPVAGRSCDMYLTNKGSVVIPVYKTMD